MRLVLLLLLASATAHADPCSTAPKNTKLRKLQLVRDTTKSNGMAFDPGFKEAAGSEFPAVSKDGKLVVHLFHDEEDFTGAPVNTLVIYDVATAKIIDSVAVGGATPTTKPDVALKKANKLLAATQWRPLPVSRMCDDGAITIDGGAFKYDPDTNQLTRGGQKVNAGFPQTGTRLGDKADGAGQACGDTVGLESGFGTGGLVVLVPHSSFGGDSCMGALASARSTAFVIR